MGKKFKQILEGKHRNHTLSQMSKSTGYAVIHEICNQKLLATDSKMELIDKFCHDVLTVQDVADGFINEQNI